MDGKGTPYSLQNCQHSAVCEGKRQCVHVIKLYDLFHTNLWINNNFFFNLGCTSSDKLKNPRKNSPPPPPQHTHTNLSFLVELDKLAEFSFPLPSLFLTLNNNYYFSFTGLPGLIGNVQLPSWERRGTQSGIANGNQPHSSSGLRFLFFFKNICSPRLLRQEESCFHVEVSCRCLNRRLNFSQQLPFTSNLFLLFSDGQRDQS